MMLAAPPNFPIASASHSRPRAFSLLWENGRATRYCIILRFSALCIASAPTYAPSAINADTNAADARATSA